MKAVLEASKSPLQSIALISSPQKATNSSFFKRFRCKYGFSWVNLSMQRSVKGKIGYEENASADVGILEVIAILTLFHPSYNEKGKAPTSAYSSRGTLNNKLTNQEFAPGYKSLSPIILDILRLHDFVYCNFNKSYNQAFPNGKLGKRRSFPPKQVGYL